VHSTLVLMTEDDLEPNGQKPMCRLPSHSVFEAQVAHGEVFH
jgi:hypothetical protein